MKRREFMAGSALASMAALVPMAANAAAGATTREALKKLVGTTFEVWTRATGITVLELFEVRESVRSAKAKARTDAFTLLFRGPLGQELGEDVYSLNHGSGAELFVRLEPVRSDAAGVVYRSPFCLLLR